MYNNKVKDLQISKDNEKHRSCPYEFLWVVDFIEKPTNGLSKEDINLLSNIGIPLTSLNSELV